MVEALKISALVASGYVLLGAISFWALMVY